jgi:hypothetical protein
MPDIHFECPKCTQSIDAPEELANQLTECPTCKETIEVPMRSRPPKAPTPPPQAPQPPVVPPPPKRQLPPSGQEICETCGSVGFAVTQTKGSLLTELILWLFFLLPGMIYSAWRLTTRQKVCRHCGGKTILIGTPRGQQLWSTYHH